MQARMRYRAMALWVGVAAFAATSPAAAQVPPASPETVEIAACLCLGQAVGALSTDVTAKQRSSEADRDELARLDAQQQSARAGIDVNNPEAVARFRQALAQRDAAHKRWSNAVEDYNAEVRRYNARVGEYNQRCANRPRNPELVAQAQTGLSCPPPY